MANSVLSLTTTPRYPFSSLINSKEICNFIYTLIRQCGVQLQPSIIDITVFMLIMFKILGETLNSILMSQSSVLYGKRTKI